MSASAAQALIVAYTEGKISLVDFQQGLAALPTAESADETAAAQEETAKNAASDKSRRAPVRVEPSDNPDWGDVVIRKQKSPNFERSFYLWAADVEEVANGLLEQL